MKNEWEEDFLKRYATRTLQPAALIPPPLPKSGVEPCCLRVRSSHDPTVSIQWKKEGDTATLPMGGVAKVSLMLTLRRDVNSATRRVRWVLYSSSPPDCSVMVNGIAIKRDASISLVADDIFGLEDDGANLWRVEWGEGFLATVEDAATLPNVLSCSPFAVGESAANQETFGIFRSKVELLEQQLLTTVRALSATKEVGQFNHDPLDPPQLEVLHRLDWLALALQRLQAKLVVKPKLSEKESQTQSLHPSTSAGGGRHQQGANHILNHVDPNTKHPTTARHSTSSSLEGLPAVSLMHQLWVARQQLSQVGEQWDYMEALSTLHHRNAELERRLYQLQHGMAARDDELQRLRQATRVDPLRSNAAVNTLQRFLEKHGKGDSSVGPLDAGDMAEVWSSVAELLGFARTAECLAEAAQCQLQQARQFACAQYTQFDALRDEVVSLRAQGNVEVVVALQQTVGDLASQLGSIGHAPMSVWLQQP